jgi:DNA-3-methyladenine glycosylase
MNHPDPLTGFFDAPADDVAPRLLGATLISRRGGRVTRGRHRGNESLYRPPGTWYVYLSYGIHWCANLICGPEGSGGAVLLRALEPMGGFAAMRERRSGRAQAEWCSGPGKLCQAMGITRRLDGVAVAASRVSIELPPPTAPVSVAQGPRVGISKARDWPLRFWLEGTPWCSPG